MNFSELFKHSGALCQFSPDGKYLANAVQYRLVVREVRTLQIVNLFTCLDAIQCVKWSPDSEFIMCAMYKRGLIQVWSIEQAQWKCKIDEGSGGVVDVQWSPDSRHILSTAEFHLRITIWSLLNKSVSYIKYPKACVKGLDFCENGKYLVLAERRECKDYISIFDCATWHLVKHFEANTDDLAGVCWSPNGRVIAVWDTCTQYKVLVYSLDGRCLTKFALDVLGIKAVTWAPSSQFLAIGSYDQKIRVLNHITWSLIVDHEHPATLENSKAVIYKEVIKKPALLRGETEPPVGVAYNINSKYEVLEGAVSLPSLRPDMNKANVKLGIGTLTYSPDSKYLLSRNDNMPNALWIWSVQDLKLSAVLIQDSPIKCVEWDPTQSRLALCTGTNKIYMWSPAGSLSVDIPNEATFQVHNLRWHPSGDILLLMGREDMCVCFLTDDNDNS